jgi:FkbM family methyltransferase
MFVDRYRFPHGLEYERLPVSAIARSWRDVVAAHGAFGDRQSRALFRALLIYRVLSPRLSSVTRDRTMAGRLDRFMAADRVSQPIPGAPSILGAPVERWRASYNGRAVEIDTIKYGLYWTEASDQYYLHRGDVYVGPEPGDVIVDAGACLGDTAVKMAAYGAAKVYSFDPFPPHVRTARAVAARNGLADRIEAYCCGVAAASRPDPVSALASPVHDEVAISPGRPIEPSDAAVSIDDFARAIELRRLDYIKMDIEGSEAAALTGARDTISRFRPKLAICVYHRPSDLWTIPLEIKRRYPFYRLYLGHHSLHAEETVLYATR